MWAKEDNRVYNIVGMVVALLMVTPWHKLNHQERIET